MRFEAVTPEAARWIDQLRPDEAQKYWVHYNAYWYENSLARPDIAFRLIHADDHPDPVGVVAYGRHYRDEALTEPVAGWYEVIHMVIDRDHQRHGYGRKATALAIAELRAMPDVEAIVIAHNPANEPARRLYEALGFVEIGRNYDGDPLLRLA